MLQEITTTNRTYPKGGFPCSKDSFVVNQTLAFQIKSCGKSPALRVAAKRLAQWRAKWLIEHSTSHQLLWYIDSFVLRNPPLRQASNR